MKIQSMFRIFGGFAALALVLSMGSLTSSAQTGDSEQISDLLLQAKSHAVLAQNDAETLESFTRSKLGWQSHAAQLQVIGEHINDLGKLNKQLSDLRGEGSPWQQTAIDQVDARLRELADVFTQTMNHLKEHKSQVNMSAYQELARANYDLVRDLAGMISDFVDYDEATSAADALENKLELSGVQAAQ